MKFINYALIVAALLTSKLSFSQIEIDESKKQLKDGIEKVMKQKLIEKLSIDETTADKFLKVTKDNRKQLRQFGKERKEIMESIELDPNAADIESKLDKLTELDSKIVSLRSEYLKELKTFLTPQQIAQSMILRKNFQKQLKNEIMQRRKRNKDF